MERLEVVFSVALGLGFNTALQQSASHSTNVDSLPQGNSPNSLVKNRLEAHLRQGRTLKITHGADLAGVLDRVFILDRPHLFLGQGTHGVLVVTQVEFRANENDGNARRVMRDFGLPLHVAVSVLRCWGPQ